jgi:hypothetical protein
MHHDDNIYDEVHKLNPQRFDHLDGKPQLPTTKTSEICLPFGHGLVPLSLLPVSA